MPHRLPLSSSSSTENKRDEPVHSLWQSSAEQALLKKRVALLVQLLRQVGGRGKEAQAGRRGKAGGRWGQAGGRAGTQVRMPHPCQLTHLFALPACLPACLTPYLPACLLAYLACSMMMDEFGGVVCPADSLARCMLAYMLPEQWQGSVQQWAGA